MEGKRHVKHALVRRVIEERRDLRKRLLLEEFDTSLAIRDTPEDHVRSGDRLDLAAHSFRKELHWTTREKLTRGGPSWTGPTGSS